VNPRSNPIPRDAGSSHDAWWQSWRIFPAIYAALGVVILAARIKDGHTTDGLIWFGVMAAIAAIYGFGGRFDLIRQARGDLSDEREVSISTHAMAATGTILVVVLTLCIAWELARGNNATPYSSLMAVGGIVYIASLVVSRFRS
jgi:hypothetical protein